MLSQSEVEPRYMRALRYPREGEPLAGSQCPPEKKNNMEAERPGSRRRKGGWGQRQGWQQEREDHFKEWPL